jgi:hypothetical protein
VIHTVMLVNWSFSSILSQESWKELRPSHNSITINHHMSSGSCQNGCSLIVSLDQQASCPSFPAHLLRYYFFNFSCNTSGIYVSVSRRLEVIVHCHKFFYCAIRWFLENVIFFVIPTLHCTYIRKSYTSPFASWEPI